MNYIYTVFYTYNMIYQLPNGKVIYLTIEQFLDLTDLDIQYLMAVNAGEHMVNPFTDSAIIKTKKEKEYDFDYLPDDEAIDDKISDDEPFDDIIDLSDNTDI